MTELTDRQIHEAADWAIRETARRLAGMSETAAP
jgi:hypothetical protein